MMCYRCAIEGKDMDAIGICDQCGRNLCKEHIGTCDICGNSFCKEHLNICDSCRGNFCDRHTNYDYKEERNDCCIWDVIDGIRCDNCWVPSDDDDKYEYVPC